MKEDNCNSLFWERLTEVQQKELLLSYDESFDPENLVSHEYVKKQHEKWLNSLNK